MHVVAKDMPGRVASGVPDVPCFALRIQAGTNVTVTHLFQATMIWLCLKLGNPEFSGFLSVSLQTNPKKGPSKKTPTLSQDLRRGELISGQDIHQDLPPSRKIDRFREPFLVVVVVVNKIIENASSARPTSESNEPSCGLWFW